MPSETKQTNMYGCTPCPKCGEDFRYPTQEGMTVCDDCGFEEPIDAN